MSTDEARPASPARMFGGVVDAYDRGRPGYPRAVAAWLAGTDPARVLELGAGTGKLTAELVALGHDVHATDPDDRMLDVLRRDLPELRVSQGGAEEIAASDASYDVVVSAQAFHWFDTSRALPEISRVLRTGGRLSLVWNQRDERIPWVRRLGRIIDSHDRIQEPVQSLTASELFDEVETAETAFWQGVDRSSIQDLVLSRSTVSALDERGRAAKLAETLALYDEYGRGMDGMQLPYVARCFRATALDRVTPTLTSAGTSVWTADTGDRMPAIDAEPSPTGTAGRTGQSEQSDGQDSGQDSGVGDGATTDLLLIDLR